MAPPHRLATSPAHDLDDPFSNSRMAPGEHLEELRRRLWRATVGFGLIVVLCFVLDFIGYATGTPLGVGKPAMDLIVQPVDKELQAFHERRLRRVARDLREGTPETRSANALRDVDIELDLFEVARKLAPLLGLVAHDLEGRPPHYVPLTARVRPLSWGIAIGDAQRLIGPRPGLAAMSVTEVMVVYLKVTLACGLVLASPWVCGQLWAFVAAGLYAHEKRYVYCCLPFSLALFLAGVAVCQVVVLPKAVEALLAFNEWFDINPDLRLTEWLGFALLMPLVFGVAFQTPLVMVVLNRLGLVSAAGYRRQRRLAWFLLAAFAAIAVPSADYLSMLGLWIPLGLLYELGIVLCVRTAAGGEPISDPAAEVVEV
jgi:sec-independent protein translocase protein TatC